MADVLAIELKYHDGTSEKTRYVTDAAKFVTKPTDTPANIAFLPRLMNRSVYAVNAIRDASTFGNSEASFGQIEIVNEGALDSWLNDGVAGREIIIRRGDDAAAYPAGFQTIFRGLQATIESAIDKIIITFADRQQLLQKPLQRTFFAGSNSLPNGLEGVADLKGKPKPRIYGRCKKVPLQIVNTARLIYQTSDKEAAVTAVFDGGLALTAGAAYASQAAMEATAPAAGQYRVWQPAGAAAFVRLGSSPAKVITADVDAAGTASDWTVAQIMKQVAIDAGFSAGDIFAADVTALDAANSAVVGFALNDTSTAMQVMNAVAASIGAVFWTDALQRLRMFRVAAPSGTPVATLTKAEIITIERSATRDAGFGVPCYRVELDYRRYWRTQSTIDTVSAVEADRPDLAEQYRRVSSVDASIQTKHLNAPVLTFQTLLDVEAAAQSESDRRLTLYKASRQLLRVTAVVRSDVLALLTAGSLVTILLPRFGCDAGALFLVLGVEYTLKENKVTLTIWG
ncbi:MAG: hypothetical protein ING73_17175 [Rhodocyclaceae bacterium]|nr:hypothetical protein [Rhodocyclaceae bacterium]